MNILTILSVMPPFEFNYEVIIGPTITLEGTFTGHLVIHGQPVITLEGSPFSLVLRGH